MRVADFSPLPVSPLSNGASVRIEALAQRLAGHHEVDVVAAPWRAARARGRGLRTTDLSPTLRQHVFGGRTAWAALETSRRAWVGTPVSAGAALSLAGRRGVRELAAGADVLLSEFPWPCAPLRRLAPDVPLVLMAHNVEADKFVAWAESQGVSPARSPWVRYAARAEAGAARAADLVTTVSADDREALIERYGLDPGRVTVVRNGADVARYVPASDAERAAARRELGLGDRPVALFIGAPIAPNRAAVRLVRRLAERTDRFTFAIVGRVAPPERAGNLVSAGWADDLRPWLAAASVSLCPIQHGGGTKIKLLESLAAGLPSIAFAPALDGTDLRPGRDVLVAEPDEEGLLTALHGLADDPALAARVGRAGREAIETGYSWDASAAVLSDVLDEAVSAPARRPTSRRPARTPA